MIAGLIFPLAPALPPRDFINPPAIYQDGWGNALGEPLEQVLGSGFFTDRTSSSSDGGLLKLVANQRDWPTGTTSKIELEPALKQIVAAMERADKVRTDQPRENVFEIRRLTGFGWGQIATLLDVDRRTVHNWTKGAEVRESNAARIADVLAVLRFIDRGTSKENAAVLLRDDDGAAFNLLVAERFEDVRTALGAGQSRTAALSRADFSTDVTDRLLGQVAHPDADPNDTAELAETEPMPAARRRSVRRS